MIVLHPYPTLIGDVVMSVDSVRIDGKQLSSSFINPDVPEVAFRELESEGWSEAVIDVTVTAPAVELSGTSAWHAPVAVVQVACNYTNGRWAVPMTPDPDTPARWTGTVELNRAEWFGRALLRAVLTATVQDVPFRMIGRAEDWTLSFDDLPMSPVHGSIAVQWIDFAADTDRGLQLFKDDAYHLRLDPEAPSLLLNSTFDGLEALLGDRKRRPPAEQAMHDSTRSRIAAEAWQAMFVTALDAVDTDPETDAPDWPTPEWRAVVLKRLLPRMYRHLGPDDALVEAVTARRSGDGASDLWERLIPAAAEEVGATTLLRRGIALLEKDAGHKEAQE